MNTIFVEILLLYNRFDMYFITEMFVIHSHNPPPLSNKFRTQIKSIRYA